MKDQECKQMALEYKDGYDETCNGVINLRFQYVHSEVTLYKQLAEKYQEQSDLIEKFIQSLALVKIENRETTPETNGLEDSSRSQRAGFYSYVDDDSALGGSPANSFDKQHLMDSPNHNVEYSYDMTSNHLFNQKEEYEERKSQDFALSLQPGW
mmetsp:Transcript_19839/g.19465  ORF Transcript_19839/g.19465 Transcript_19839/m.19465 type:complete len:154 (-) Transcript_19839:19-480(-)